MGDVLHFIKDGDVGFKNFGEVYFSNIKYGKVKAWKTSKYDDEFSCSCRGGQICFSFTRIKE